MHQRTLSTRPSHDCCSQQQEDGRTHWQDRNEHLPCNRKYHAAVTPLTTAVILVMMVMAVVVMIG
jgi:hypothetical protein